jgi:hypothetical protein
MNLALRWQNDSLVPVRATLVTSKTTPTTTPLAPNGNTTHSTEKEKKQNSEPMQTDVQPAQSGTASMEPSSGPRGVEDEKEKEEQEEEDEEKEEEEEEEEQEEEEEKEEEEEEEEEEEQQHEKEEEKQGSDQKETINEEKKEEEKKTAPEEKKNSEEKKAAVESSQPRIPGRRTLPKFIEAAAKRRRELAERNLKKKAKAQRSNASPKKEITKRRRRYDPYREIRKQIKLMLGNDPSIPRSHIRRCIMEITNSLLPSQPMRWKSLAIDAIHAMVEVVLREGFEQAAVHSLHYNTPTVNPFEFVSGCLTAWPTSADSPIRRQLMQRRIQLAVTD